MHHQMTEVRASSAKIGERIGWIDQLRVIACFAVVLIHVSGEAYARFASGPVWEWWLANVLNGSARAAVPLFVMISGALAKEGDCLPTHFYRKKALRLLPVFLAWSALYVAFDMTALHLSAREIYLLFISKGFVYLHLWYLSMLAFLLAFVPYLVRIKYPTPLGGEGRVKLLAICIVVVSLDWLFDFLCRIHEIPFLYWTRTFVEFVPYFLLGMLLAAPKSSSPARPWGGYLLGALVVSWLANFLTCEFLGIAEDSRPLANRSPFVLAVAVAAFLFVRDGGVPWKSSPWWGRLGDASLGIYLLHPLFLWLFRRVSRGTDWDPLSGGWMIVTALVAFIISYVCITVFRLLEIGRKLT